MWQDYVSLIPAAMAVVSGALSGITAILEPKSKAYRAVVVGLSAMLAVGTIVTTFWALGITLRQQESKKTTRLYLQNTLGYFIEKGQEIQNKIPVSVPEDIPQSEADNWSENVEAFLLQNLGRAYVIRFRNTAGMPGIGYSSSEPVPERTRRLWSGLNNRLVRLEQFSEQIPVTE